MTDMDLSKFMILYRMVILVHFIKRRKKDLDKRKESKIINQQWNKSDLILKILQRNGKQIVLFDYSTSNYLVALPLTKTFPDKLISVALRLPLVPTLALSALIAYAISLYLIKKSERYRNVFGVLCTAYVAFQIQTVSVLLLWAIVRIMAHKMLRSFPWKIFMRIASPMANSALYATIWMQLVLAVNRLFAISYPMRYNRIFNRKNARIIATSVWSFSMLITVLYYNVECVRYVEADVYSWSTLYGPCKHSFLAYIAIILSDHIILITVVVNAIAFYRIVARMKKSKLENSFENSFRSLNRDITFFKETCVTTVAHAFLIAIVRIDGLFLARVTKIIYTWLAMSTVDSFIFLFFNHNLMFERNTANLFAPTNNLVAVACTKQAWR
uniref:G_PROTEIN_RECEP_F1_2 domain-containing protein n=1 Tax=Elaeophora elaphi TaxID=1147741 RepID=A0A0R3RKJ2_9BILA